MALKILLVEDNANDRKVLQAILKRAPQLAQWPLEIMEAPDGETALATVESSSPDVVITDLLIPKKNGTDVCFSIRAEECHADVAIIAVSGVYKDSRTALDLKTKANVELLSKPIDADQLLGLLTKLLQQRLEALPTIEARWKEPATPAADPDTMNPVASDAPESTGESDASPPGSDSSNVPPPVVLDSKSETTQSASEPRTTIPKPMELIQLTKKCSGTLANHPLASLLIVAAHQKATTRIKLARGKIRKNIFVLKGDPIYVDSNLRNETLGAYLQTQGLIDEGQLSEALRHAKSSGKKLGEALVELQLVDELTVKEGLLSQTQIKIASALRWQDGTFINEPGDSFSSTVPHCAVDAVKLVLHVLMRFVSPDDANEKVARHSEMGTVLSAPGIVHKTLIEQLFGSELVKAQARHSTIEQLLSSSPNRGNLAVQLEILQQAQLIEIRPVSETRLMETTKPTSDTERTSRPASDTLESDCVAPPPPTGFTTTDSSPAASGGPTDEYETLAQGSTAHLVDQAAAHSFESVNLPSLENYRQSDNAPSDEDLSVPIALGQLHDNRDVGAESDFSVAPPSTAHAPTLGNFDSGEVRIRINAGSLGSMSTTRGAAVSDIRMAAELWFKEGERLLQENNAEAAIPKLKAAADAIDDQADYAALLAWAVYCNGQEPNSIAEARPYLDTAFRIDRTSTTAHEVAGRIDENEGDLVAAAEHYAQSLKNGTFRPELFRKLRDLRKGLAQYEQLERDYRRYISQMRTVEPMASVPLWLELAYLYRDTLNNPANATVALDVVQKLDPKNSQLAAARATEGEISNWRRVAQGLQQRWANDTANCAPLHHLFKLYQGLDHHDLLAATGSVLVALGDATTEERSIVGQFRPATVEQHGIPLDRDLLAQLRDPDDDAAIEAVIEQLSDVLCECFSKSLEEFGADSSTERQLADLPEPVARLLTFVATQLSIELPKLYISTYETVVAPFPGRVRALLLPEQLLTSDDEREIVTQIARAMGCLGKAKRHVFSRPGSEMKTVFSAALAACNSGTELPTEDASNSFHRISQMVSQTIQADQLRRSIESAQRVGQTINFTQWIRAAHRTAARIALLVSGDVLSTLSTVGNDTQTFYDIAQLSISTTYQELLDQRRLAALS